jgi:hypothetical protein
MSIKKVLVMNMDEKIWAEIWQSHYYDYLLLVEVYNKLDLGSKIENFVDFNITLINEIIKYVSE